MPRKKPTTNAGKKAKMSKLMKEYKGGKLHSGSKTGPKVKSRKQAIAIGLSESGQSKKRSKDSPSRTPRTASSSGTGKSKKTKLEDVIL